MTSQAKQLGKFSVVVGLVLMALPSRDARGGPTDQATRYHAAISVGPLQGLAIVDGGGLTTLSFTDAIKAGLLDANGDPAVKPSSQQHVGGLTGGSVLGWNFDNVNVAITPTAGGQRTTTTSVFVPEKPANQAGPDDATKQKKTNSISDSLGANVVGSTIGKGFLLHVDLGPTANPDVNRRVTAWSNLTPGGPNPPPQVPIPVVIPSNGGPAMMPNVLINNSQFTVSISTFTVTSIPTSVAAAIGLISVGTISLDFAAQSQLFADGLIDTLPGVDPLTMQYGILSSVTLPGINGPFVVNDVAALINDQSSSVVLGGNALIPSNYEGWLDGADGLFNLVSVPEPASILLSGCGGFALFFYASIRRMRTIGARERGFGTERSGRLESLLSPGPHRSARAAGGVVTTPALLSQAGTFQ